MKNLSTLQELKRKANTNMKNNIYSRLILTLIVW